MTSERPKIGLPDLKNLSNFPHFEMRKIAQYFDYIDLRPSKGLEFEVDQTSPYPLLETTCPFMPSLGIKILKNSKKQAKK